MHLNLLVVIHPLLILTRTIFLVFFMLFIWNAPAVTIFCAYLFGIFGTIYVIFVLAIDS